MREEKRQFSMPVVGGTSLLIVFAVLCLMVFALLTLSTVQADGRLSDASLKAATDYYAADTEAETIYAQLRQGTVPTGVKVEGNLYTYQCEISETQTLSVRLQKSEAGWRVLQWKAVSTIEWNTDL